MSDNTPVAGAASSEQLAPLRAAIRYGVAGLVLVTVVAVPAAAWAAGSRGAYGALLGAAIGGAYILTTALTVLLGARLAPSTAGLLVLGGWVLKMLVVLVVAAALIRLDFYAPMALFLTVVAALVVVIGAELAGVIRTKVPYTHPDPS